MGIEEALPFVFNNGNYVTAMRRKIEVGEVIAISSVEPLPDMGEGDVLVVFDMSFRVEAGTPYVPSGETSRVEGTSAQNADMSGTSLTPNRRAPR